MVFWLKPFHQLPEEVHHAKEVHPRLQLAPRIHPAQKAESTPASGGYPQSKIFYLKLNSGIILLLQK